jgi:hypothetical protein
MTARPATDLSTCILFGEGYGKRDTLGAGYQVFVAIAANQPFSPKSCKRNILKNLTREHILTN